MTAAGGVAGLLAAMPAAAQAPAVTAFVDVTVIPMDRERVLAQQTVVVRGDRIVALGPVARVQVPEGAQRIDGRGKYLIPGLADMHVHFLFDGRDLSLTLLKNLASGVTTVRDMHSGPPGSETESTVLKAKRAVASGTLLGPRIYTAGDITLPYRTIGGGDTPTVYMFDTSATRLATIAGDVAALKQAGHDFVKLYGWPHPIYDSVMKAARRVRLRVVGHVPSFDASLERVLQDRYASIEHLTGYLAYLTGGFPLEAINDRSWIRPVLDTLTWARPGYQWDPVKLRAIAVATRQAGVWNCPTLVGMGGLGSIAQFRADSLKVGADSISRIFWRTQNNYIDFALRLTKALQEAGAGLLLGTDNSGIDGWRYSASDELREMVEEAGLTPYQALATGTRNVAAFLGTLDSTGTVAKGKRADLLLLTGNPLQDIRATAAQAGVMVGGRWLARADLDARLRSRTP